MRPELIELIKYLSERNSKFEVNNPNNRITVLSKGQEREVYFTVEDDKEQEQFIFDTDIYTIRYNYSEYKALLERVKNYLSYKEE